MYIPLFSITRIKIATGEPMAGEKTTTTGHMRTCGRLLEIDPRDQEKHASGGQAIEHTITSATRDALPYAKSVMEANVSLAVTGRNLTRQQCCCRGFGRW
jgi:hypothetical protein